MYPTVEEAKALIAELCNQFYSQGWVSGTGGGISVRAQGDAIVMAPSGVQKERMQAQDMFVLGLRGNILHTPARRPPPFKEPKLSECSPLFMLAYELRGAGAVIHSHSMSAVLATLLDPTAPAFRCTHLEMMKGIAGHGFYDALEVPIIENTARECELTGRMRGAMLHHPRTSAVLVRRHGVYVWGRTWVEAKTQAECYDYLFGLAARMADLGVDAARPPPRVPAANGRTAPEGALRTSEEDSARNGTEAGAAAPGRRGKRARAGGELPACVVLDIEGTVAPISFVAETLFPYARAHARAHLEAEAAIEHQPNIRALRAQAEKDIEAGIGGAVAIPAGPSAAVIDACMENITAQMDADRKTPALKALQGEIWHEAYAGGAIRGELFRDVPDTLQWLRDLGVRTYIYSSGSRQAQRDLFGHTTVGDLRPYLLGYFDTVVGPKNQASSYVEIYKFLGVDDPAELLFATDTLAEAQAATEAGWRAVLVTRPGNAELPKELSFRVIASMDELLEGYMGTRLP